MEQRLQKNRILFAYLKVQIIKVQKRYHSGNYKILIKIKMQINWLPVVQRPGGGAFSQWPRRLEGTPA